MKKLTMLMLLILSAGMVAAQDVEIHVTYPDVYSKLYDHMYVANKKKAGKYSVYLEINTYHEKGIQKFFTILNSDEKVLFTRHFDTNTKASTPRHTYTYTYRYYQGEINGNINSNFVYRLPFAKDEKHKVEIFKYDKSESEDGGNDIVENVAYVFNAQKNDDVYAMRKGVVTKIEDTQGSLKDFFDDQMLREDYIFSSPDGFNIYATRNGVVMRIEDMQWFTKKNVSNDQTLKKASKLVCIEHEDGTTAQYIGIMDGTVTVSEGDMVYPDMVLGKAGTLDEKRYTIIVSIVYLTAPLKGKIPDFDKVKRNALNPMFLTDVGTVQLENGKKYASVVTDKLITEEITKREQKNRKE